MLLGIKDLTLDQYQNLRYLLIKQVEGTHGGTPYIDSVGQVTIGIGFNIEGNGGLRNRIYEYFKIGLNEENLIGENYRRLLDNVIENATNTTDLQGDLNAIMHQRWLANGSPADMPQEFTLPDNDAVLRPMFDLAVQDYENRLTNFLDHSGGNLPSSYERLTLISLQWNDSPASPRALLRVGNNLSNALLSGNRATAWYEIGHNSGGPYNRRRVEAHLFGLYNDANNVDDAEAEQVVSMYLEHRATIESHETADIIRDANFYLDQIGITKNVDTLGQILKPIANYILEHYTPAEVQQLARSGEGFSGDVVLGYETSGSDGTFIQPVYRWLYNTSPTDESALPEGVTGINDLLVGVDGKSYAMQGLYGDDMIIGADMNDTLYGGYKEVRLNSGNDTLVGGGGDDKLYGQDGNDVLVGGAGEDTLIGGEDTDKLEGGTGKDIYQFDGEFGRDIIEDADNDGQVVINGVVMGTFYQVDDADNIYVDDKNNPKYEIVRIQEGDAESLLITPLNAGVTAGSVLVKNWASGGLGITLTTGAPAVVDPGRVGVVNGTGGGNAISLFNLLTGEQKTEDYYPGESDLISLKAEGGAGRDLMMGLVQGSDTLSGGEGDDIILGGNTRSLLYMSDEFGVTPRVESVGNARDSLDGGDGDDWIIATGGTGSVARGGTGNDSLHADYAYYY